METYFRTGSIGSGFYGSVIATQSNQGSVLYAAKTYNFESEAVAIVKYEEACPKILSLQHTNIIRFTKVYVFEVPYLVMERLEMSLAHLLATIHDIPLPLKLSIMSDTCSGLAYLHDRNPSVVHGDLIPTNVLLTTCFAAKISDVGNRMIVNIMPRDLSQKLLSQSSRSLVYLPLMDLMNATEYNTSMDVFSLGKIMLHVLTQVFSAAQHCDLDSENRDSTQCTVESYSCEKCVETVQALFGNDFPEIVEMVVKSIHEDPEERPTCTTILEMLQDVMKKAERSHGGRETGIATVMVTMQMMAKERRIQELENELKTLREERPQIDTGTLDSVSAAQEDSFQYAYPVDERGEPNIEQKTTNVPPARWTLTWNKREDMEMPFDMSRNIQLVEINGNLYIGGGDAERTDIENEFKVMSFNIPLKRWRVLEHSYIAKWFSMVAIDGKLTLVGGRNKDRKDENMLGVWDGSDWTKPFPPMPTGRSHCSVALYQTWLIVAGGTTVDLDTLSIVEVLNLDNQQWHRVKDASIPFYSMKSVVLGNIWYLMGGYHGHTITHDVFSVQLDRIVSGNESTNVWKCLAKLQCFYSTPLLMHENLLAVGGRTSAYKSEDTVYAHDKENKNWFLAAKLPCTINNCASAIIANTLYVFGGYDGTNRQRSVYTASIQQCFT